MLDAEGASRDTAASDWADADAGADAGTGAGAGAVAGVGSRSGLGNFTVVLERRKVSVALNTAEGAANIKGHKRQRYQSALGSAREVKACIDVAQAMRYIGEVDVEMLDRLSKVIGTLVRLVNGRA